MAFQLKKVLKALLFSTGQPLSIKDIQDTIARFHERAQKELFTPAGEVVPAAEAAAGGDVPPAPEGAGEAAVPGIAAAETEVLPEPVLDPELYENVPELVTAAEIREAMEQIALELKVADDGLLLIENRSGYRLATHPRFARWVRILRQEPPPARLSVSSLETLAVVAYRQPVTRTEIEAVRGVSAEAGLTRLLERELVAITGRADLPGRPLQYGTTDKFLEFVGIKSLDELPASDVLSARQIDEWLRNAATQNRPDDAAMGLENELPLEAGQPAPQGEENAAS